MDTKSTMLVIGGAVGALAVSAILNSASVAAPGTLDPPAGPVEGTGVTTQQLADDIASLRQDVQAISSPPTGRLAVPVQIDDGVTETVTVGVQGRAILHSVVASFGFFGVSDANGSLGAVSAVPLLGATNISYIGSNQVDYGVVVDLPITLSSGPIDEEGTVQSISATVIYTPLP
ncbi:MAG: hypothetical protein AAGH64_10870 [Planctomycetota bacterium]